MKAFKEPLVEQSFSFEALPKTSLYKELHHLRKLGGDTEI